MGRQGAPCLHWQCRSEARLMEAAALLTLIGIIVGIGACIAWGSP